MKNKSNKWFRCSSSIFKCSIFEAKKPFYGLAYEIDIIIGTNQKASLRFIRPHGEK